MLQVDGNHLLLDTKSTQNVLRFATGTNVTSNSTHANNKVQASEQRTILERMMTTSLVLATPRNTHDSLDNVPFSSKKNKTRGF